MRKNGFTLLEVLISIAILGVVAVVVGMSLRLSVRAWERGEAEAEASQKERIFSERLSQQIKSVFPYPIEVEHKKVVAFSGTSDAVWFVTASSNPSGSGFTWLSYFMKEGVLMADAGIVPDKELTEKAFAKGEVFDPEVREIKFEYYSTDDEDWEESWELKEKLPGALKVTVNSGTSFVVSIPAGEKSEESK